jgi:hypothetical protein
MEVNPYAAPQSRVDDVVPDGLDLEVHKALRGDHCDRRLIAD